MRTAGAVLLAVFMSGCAAPPTVTAPGSDAAPPQSSTIKPWRGAVAYIPSAANPVCAVTRIVDGDSVGIACQRSGEHTARLVGFDTPETYRPGCEAERRKGEEAKRVLSQSLRAATTLRAKFEGTGRYGRPLIRLWLDSLPLERIMVQSGVAVPYDGGRRINWCARLRDS